MGPILLTHYNKIRFDHQVFPLNEFTRMIEEDPLGIQWIHWFIKWGLVNYTHNFVLNFMKIHYNEFKIENVNSNVNIEWTRTTTNVIDLVKVHGMYTCTLSICGFLIFIYSQYIYWIENIIILILISIY